MIVDASAIVANAHGEAIDRLLDDYGIRIEAVDAGQARVAAQAYRDYGRGSGHPAVPS